MKLQIGFVTGGLPFSGKTLGERSLGGSETACLYLAKALAARGHSVDVFCECDAPGMYDGVAYMPHQAFKQLVPGRHYDVLVASRWMEYLATPHVASLDILWIHDTLVDNNRTMSCMWTVDKIFALSDFHIQNYTGEGKLPELKDYFWKTSNGVDLRTVETNIRPKVPNKLIYTSRPERGLHFLLAEIFPRLLQVNPDLKLYFANYDLMGMQLPPEVQQAIAVCQQLAAQNPNCIIPLGNLTKEKLYQEISSSQLLLYPTSFPEISCLTALEAQACGTPIVTTNNFALKETIGPECGTLVEGLPPDPHYIDDFCKKTLELLGNQVKYQKMAKAGPAWINEKGYTWEAVAEKWEAKFISMMQERWDSKPKQIIKELLRQDDVVPATLLAGNSTFPATAQIAVPPVAQAVDDLRKALPRYDKQFELIKAGGKIPKTLLELNGGHASFGMYYKKRVPDSEVTIVETNEEMADRIDQFAQASKQDVRVLTGEEFNDNNETFDLVVCSEQIDRAYDPSILVDGLFGKCADDGALLLTTQFGATRWVTPKESPPNKLWNLDFKDYSEMLNNEKGFLTTFVETHNSYTGDINGHWCVLARKDMVQPNFVQKAVERRKTNTRPYKSIAACLIVKDEEDTLGKCLKVIRPFMDSIYVTVDSKTTDGTVEIAKRHADVVKIVDFDNFAQQRNASIANVEEDFIFWLDADEVTVGANNLRKYLRADIFRGFVVAQRHLMLDVQGTFDIPVRVFKNVPEHKFVGCIHEHCEDIGKGIPDNAIHPTLQLPDVDLAHYGYINERIRRKKCSNRNMNLLRRDLVENPKRMLTKVLAMRDFLNIARWRFEQTKRFDKDELELLEACVAMYLKYFADTKHKYHDLSFPMYQEALQFLAMSNKPFEERKTPPFQVSLAMFANNGPTQNDPVKPNKMWFIDDDQFMQFIKNKAAELVTQLGVGSVWKHKKELQNCQRATFKSEHDAVALLGRGANVINWNTI